MNEFEKRKDQPKPEEAEEPRAVERAPGRRTLVQSTYGAVQTKRARGRDLDGESVHATAQAGLQGQGGALPFLEHIQESFGAHDVSGIRAHTGGAATEANTELGSLAFATGDAIAFAGAPDLHTAAHEAAHVVQQRAGVHLKEGVGEVGDVYEQHADAVADRVVKGESAESLLSTLAGSPAGAGAVQLKAVQFIGTPLGQPLPAGAPVPAPGSTKSQRRYSPEQYIEMWEQEQGRKMTAEEKATINRGCIGITAANIDGGGNPLSYAEGTYGTFEQAHAKMIEFNGILDWMATQPGLTIGPERYILFAKLFWSNQSANWKDRMQPNDKAFRPDPKTGKVDMTGYNYEPRSREETHPETGATSRSSYINFDYGFWDEASQSFWHANHMEYPDPDRAREDPMVVLQSTKEKFAKGYIDFDRVIYCVAKAMNYNPGLAAITHAGAH